MIDAICMGREFFLRLDPMLLEEKYLFSSEKYLRKASKTVKKCSVSITMTLNDL